MVTDQLRPSSPSSEPLGRFVLAAASAVRTSSSDRPLPCRAVGFTSTRTAGRAPPPTLTWPTPATWDSFCWRIDEAMSYIRPRSTTSDVSDSRMIGASAGLDFRYRGLGRFAGSWPRAALMAACTSRAAASMLRLSSNWSVMLVEPRPLDDVISVTPAMRPNWRSSGVATAEAIVSGLAPGRPALTLMVGNSTWGSGETGSSV